LERQCLPACEFAFTLAQLLVSLPQTITLLLKRRSLLLKLIFAMGESKLAIVNGLVLGHSDLDFPLLKRFAIDLQLHALTLDCVTLGCQPLILELLFQFILTLAGLAILLLKLSDPLRNVGASFFTGNNRAREKRCSHDRISKFHGIWILKIVRLIH
jgi:hypothetical protein